MQVLLAVGVVPPVLAPYYLIIIWVLIIETILLVLVGGSGIALQYEIQRRRKKRAANRSELKSTLLTMAQGNQIFEKRRFPRKWLGVSSLLSVMLEIDKENSSEQWSNLQRSIHESYLLPQARRLASSYRWTNQFKAVRCFALAPRVEDQQPILQLLKHKIPIIRYSAAHAAARLGTDAGFDAILEAMNVSTRYLRHPFHDALRDGGEKAYQYLEKRLATETNQFTRVSCLEMLSEKMNDHIVNLLESDLKSSHINLQVAAIRALGHYKNEHSIELLLPLLQCPDWQVRALAARSLGYLEAMRTIDQLAALLHDKTWWVRMNAALALRRIGGAGVETLKAQPSAGDQFAFEAAQYVLALQEVSPQIVRE